MSSFPPSKWDVRPLKDMESMEAGARENENISMEAFLAVKPAEGEEGAFRFALAGTDSIRLRFRVQDLLPDFIFDGMFIQAEMTIGQQVILEKNSVCSKWMDIVELINSQDVEVVDQTGADIPERFMDAMANYKKIAPANLSGIYHNVEFG